MEARWHNGGTHGGACQWQVARGRPVAFARGRQPSAARVNHTLIMEVVRARGVCPWQAIGVCPWQTAVYSTRKTNIIIILFITYSIIIITEAYTYHAQRGCAPRAKSSSKAKQHKYLVLLMRRCTHVHLCAPASMCTGHHAHSGDVGPQFQVRCCTASQVHTAPQVHTASQIHTSAPAVQHLGLLPRKARESALGPLHCRA